MALASRFVIEHDRSPLAAVIFKRRSRVGAVRAPGVCEDWLTSHTKPSRPIMMTTGQVQPRPVPFARAVGGLIVGVGGDAATSRPQCLQTTAASWISSAQNGHFFTVGVYSVRELIAGRCPSHGPVVRAFRLASGSANCAVNFWPLSRRKMARNHRRHQSATIGHLEAEPACFAEGVSVSEGGVPTGIRTRVLALKGPRPRPLDDGDR